VHRLILTFLIALSAQFTVAQNFVFTNGDSLTKVFEINDYSWAHTKIENSSTETVVFQWEIITYEHPVDWGFSLCDLPYCYTMGEMSGTMYPASAESIDAFLTLNIDAPSVDTGYYQIKVWDELLPENPDTLTITMISTPAFSTIEEDILKQVPSFWYDNEMEFLTFSNPSDQRIQFEIYNLFGQLILSYLIEPISEKNIFINDWKSGNYILYYGNIRKYFYVGEIRLYQHFPLFPTD
jgi:hypothetical protein